MSDDEALAAAKRLHNRIVPILCDADMQKVADFLLETWKAGYQAGVKPDPYTVTDVGLDGQRAWLMA